MGIIHDLVERSSNQKLLGQLVQLSMRKLGKTVHVKEHVVHRFAYRVTANELFDRLKLDPW